MPLSQTFHMDCMEYMKDIPDKFFSLACVDPPYGIGADKRNAHSSIRDNDKWADVNWDSHIPTAEYFAELQRVSLNQIVWGANYFVKHLSASMGWIVWFKTIEFVGRTFSECELAWTSFQRAARTCELKPFHRNGSRIHPTQKPVALYKWLLTNYAKEGDTILDTHLGSGSSRIAAYDLGFDFTGIELDKDYFDAQEARFAQHIAQANLFEVTPEPTLEQGDLYER